MRANNLKSVTATKPQSSHLSAYALQKSPHWQNQHHVSVLR